MKKKIHFLLLLTFVVLCVDMNGQGVGLTWAKTIGGTGAEFSNSVGVDAVGNVYTAGRFENTVDFDPSISVSNLTSAGGTDIFISKSDANGNFLWAKRIGSNITDFINGMVVDATGGVYMTGTIFTTTDFDPNTGVFNLITNGNAMFVSKLDTNGNFVWAKVMRAVDSTAGSCIGASIVVDASSNVYATGWFFGTVDFDPNAGVANLTSIGSDAFISKLDISGNFVWAKSLSGTNGNSTNPYPWLINVDVLGNVYTTGNFSGIVDFDPNAGVANLTSNGLTDVFVSKLDASGNFLWAKAMGGADEDGGISITVDILGNVYTTGFFFGTADFDPNAGVTNLTAKGTIDIFVSKIDVAGNFLWAKSMGGIGNDIGRSIVTDANGEIYTTGYFRDAVDFDPNIGVFNLASAGSTDAFVSKLDVNGNFVWARSIGGTGEDNSRCIVIDASNNVYTTGNFQDTVDFNPNTGITNLASAGGADIFFTKYVQCPISLANITAVNGMIGVLYSLNAIGTVATGVLTYAVAPALPAGLNLNATTGIISGIPTTITASTTYTISTMQGNCGDIKSITFAITENPATAIDNSLSNLVKVSPNPSNGDFQVDFSGLNVAKSLVRVYDAQGKQVLSSVINMGANTTISLDKMPNGLYLLEIETTKGRILKRLIKEN